MKLTDTQLVILSRASQRPDRCAGLPRNLGGGTAQKFVAKPLAASLVEQVRAEADMPIWRKGDDGAFAPSHRPRLGCHLGRGLAGPQRHNPNRRRHRIIRAKANSPASKGIPVAIKGRPAFRWRPQGLKQADRSVEAGCRLETPATEPGHHDRHHHEGDGLAGALGARVLRRCGPQEAWPEPHLRNPRRSAGLPDRSPLGKGGASDQQEEGLSHGKLEERRGPLRH
jgi:hypothetical protein